MIAIIPCAGFSSRRDNDKPKALLSANKNQLIIDQILNKLPSNMDSIIIANGKYATKFFSYGSRIYNNGVYEANKSNGCLMDITNCIECLKIQDDILIIVGSIIFDFSLMPVLDLFKTNRNICIPIMEMNTTKDSGYVEVNKTGTTTKVIEHPKKDISGMSELGIYAIDNSLLDLLRICAFSYKNDSVGYFLEFCHNVVNIPVHTVEVTGNWEHII